MLEPTCTSTHTHWLTDVLLMLSGPAQHPTTLLLSGVGGFYSLLVLSLTVIYSIYAFPYTISSGINKLFLILIFISVSGSESQRHWTARCIAPLWTKESLRMTTGAVVWLKIFLPLKFKSRIDLAHMCIGIKPVLWKNSTFCLNCPVHAFSHTCAGNEMQPREAFIYVLQVLQTSMYRHLTFVWNTSFSKPSIPRYQTQTSKTCAKVWRTTCSKRNWKGWEQKKENSRRTKFGVLPESIYSRIIEIPRLKHLV